MNQLFETVILEHRAKVTGRMAQVVKALKRGEVLCRERRS